jgi:hypothetical protein
MFEVNAQNYLAKELYARNEKAEVLTLKVDSNGMVTEIPLSIEEAEQLVQQLSDQIHEFTGDYDIEHYKKLADERSKALDTVYGIASEDFESVNQLEMIRLTAVEHI